MTRKLWLAVAWILPLVLTAQAPPVVPPDLITMDEEPHHHLALHNDYVNVFKIEVAPGDSIVLHRHAHDAVAIAIGDQEVTVGVPGKPDVHQKNVDGQVRLQRADYIHSTHVDDSSPYHTVAVELLQPQGNPRNLCAPVLAGQPLNCPEVSPDTSPAKQINQPEFESDATRVQIVRLLAHQKVDIGHLSYFQLIVLLDRASISPISGNGPDQLLRPGDFVWFDKGKPARLLNNNGNEEVRYVEIAISPSDEFRQPVSVLGERPLSGHVVKIGTR